MAAVADAAMRHYRLNVARRSLLAHTHNTSYRLQLRDGDFAVLKICPMGKNDVRHLRSEMQWVDAIGRQTALRVPRPIRNRREEFVTTIVVHGRRWHCRVFSWVPGRRLGRALRPKHYQQLGELIASLHEHAIAFRPPRGFLRPRWDVDFEKRFGNLRVAAKQRRLSRERLRFFEAARERAIRATRKVGRGRDVFGLIHADLGYANHLFHAGRAAAIDFEASGFGWFGHDIVEPLVFLQHSKRYVQLRDALLEGYRRVRPLPPGTEEHLDDFIDLSALTSVGYIAGEPTRQADLAWFSRYLMKVLRPPGTSPRQPRRT